MTDRSRWHLPRVILALGVVSLFTDVSSEMIMPLVPAFLTAELGASATFFGLVEGIAEMVAAVFKLLSGAWSDRVRRRIPLVLFGYTLSAVMRPLMGWCAAPWHALVVRAADRIGKGLRTAPRDALMDAVMTSGSRGWGFGFQRAMDHGGALLGSLLASLLLFWGFKTRQVFFLAAIPGVLAVLTILIGVRERKSATKEKTTSESGSFSWSAQPAQLKRFFLVLALFTLSNSSDTFLLLRAGELGISLKLVPMLWFLLHVTKAVTNLVGGHLSDRIGALRVIRYGWLVYGIVYVLFGFAAAPWQIWALFTLYGLYHGFTEGAEKSLVASLARPDRKGGAFGIYHAIAGFAALPASLGMGWLWDQWGSRTALALAGATAVVAACLLIFIGGERKRMPSQHTH